MTTRADLTGDLFRTVGRFRRQIRRSAGRGFDGTGLTEAQAELLRLVGRHPGVSVSQAAAELNLVANTASTLVSKLCAKGALLREPDSADRRVIRLRLTESAQQIVDDTRAARRDAMRGVLDELDDQEVDALTSGLVVLNKVTRLLNERQP